MVLSSGLPIVVDDQSPDWTENKLPDHFHNTDYDQVCE